MEIKGKVHCFFEQSGTFKNEFIKLGIPRTFYFSVAIFFCFHWGLQNFYFSIIIIKMADKTLTRETN